MSPWCVLCCVSLIRNLLVSDPSPAPDGHIQHPFPCLGPLCSRLPRSHPGSVGQLTAPITQPQATHHTITTSSITTRESNDQNRHHPQCHQWQQSDGTTSIWNISHSANPKLLLKIRCNKKTNYKCTKANIKHTIIRKTRAKWSNRTLVVTEVSSCLTTLSPLKPDTSLGKISPREQRKTLSHHTYYISSSSHPWYSSLIWYVFQRQSSDWLVTTVHTSRVFLLLLCL